MDDGKKAVLKEIFWKMNELSSFTNTETNEGNGTGITTLHITVTTKTPGEMADEYGFDEDQRQQLEELLSDERRDPWNSVGMIRVGSLGRRMGCPIMWEL